MAAPSATLHGIDDQSGRPPQYESTALSQHTPLLMLMTRRGPVEPLFLSSAQFDIHYDLKSIEVSSDWHTHQSILAQIAVKTGNVTMVVKRMVDENCKSSTLWLGKDLTTDKVVVSDLEDKQRLTSTGNVVPILEFETANPGRWGNQIGLQVFVADERKQNSLGAMLGAVIYEAVVVEEDEFTGKQRVINNLSGESSTFFTMKRDSYAKDFYPLDDETTAESIFNRDSAYVNNINYYFDDIMTASYIQPTGAVTRQEYFKYFKLNIESVAQLALNPNLFWKEDLLTAIQTDNNFAFKRNLTAFAMGGNDGFKTTSPSIVENRLEKHRLYETACYSWLASIDETNPIVDMARYPYSTLWDSGFTRLTKEMFKNVLIYRKDVWIAMAASSVHRYYEEGGETYFDYQPKLNTQESISLAIMYRSMFTGIPESQTYGTPTVRATLVCQDGVNRNSTYRKRQTINADLFEKICNYCGSGEGKWNAEKAFDSKQLNVLDNWHDMSMDYMSPNILGYSWDAGLIYVQNKDTRRKFYPTYQTLYPDDTSVLNNIFTMMACCWIEKKHYQAWTRVTGDSKSTDLEIAEKLDQYLNSSLMNAFDGRFITVSKTEYSRSDKLNGFSYTTSTDIYSTVTKHTANYKITARRMSESLT